MTRYFSILASGLTTTQEKQLADSWSGYAWWHAMPNYWLFRDHTDQLTAMQIRDTLSGIAPTAKVMVMDIQPKNWAGSGMHETNRDWLKKFWPPEGQ